MKSRPDRGIRTKIYLDEHMIGSGKVEFLTYLDRHGTMRQAAAAMGLEEARAWFLFETLQACFSDPLATGIDRLNMDALITLTPFGTEFLRRYADHQEIVERSTQPFLHWLSTRQTQS